MNPKKTGIVYLAILAAIISSLCDKVHVITGTLYYPNPHYSGQPWWSIPLFFLAFILMGITYLILIKQLPPKIGRHFSSGPGGYRSFIESLLIFAFVYILSGFGNDSPILMNILFYGTFLLRLAVAQDRGFLLILSIIIAVGGTLGEGTLSALDLVYYTKPVFYHVPAWLPALYLHGAFALKDSMRLFVFKSGK